MTPPSANTKYRHIKTGNTYIVVDTCTNCNNNAKSEHTVLYVRVENDTVVGPTYSRDLDEFLEKFELITPETNLEIISRKLAEEIEVTNYNSSDFTCSRFTYNQELIKRVLRKELYKLNITL